MDAYNQINMFLQKIYNKLALIEKKINQLEAALGTGGN
jgi:hypothetical protein